MPSVLVSSSITPKKVLKTLSAHGIQFAFVFRVSLFRENLQILAVLVLPKSFQTLLQTMCCSLWEYLHQIGSLHITSTDKKEICTLVFAQRIDEVGTVGTFLKNQKCETVAF